MKKITALLIAALLALSLCGCEQIDQLKQIELPTPSVEPSETPEPTPEGTGDDSRTRARSGGAVHVRDHQHRRAQGDLLRAR